MMFNWFRKLFSRAEKPQARAEAQPLRIEGVETTFTAEPDDAELAAQALLEMMADYISRHNDTSIAKDNSSTDSKGFHDTAYYHALADRIREAREHTRRQAVRFVYSVERELKKTHIPLNGDGSLELLEAELYKRMDIVEREGGELKRRWQHCLAEVTVRLMESNGY